ncbi:hypothetical protein [Anaeromusa acidaminophila]|uniref:hypothetical protein n=1 Tax=Anaeromusa acidaminophila TaxID=81464 RepID=UPI00036D14A1|nr:hypothetical protein [Anaeromusa acidaminophila]
MAKGLLESILVAEDFNVIFDTQGGVVLQMKDWAGYFYSEDAAAQCLLDYLSGRQLPPSTPVYAKFQPTPLELQLGWYRISDKEDLVQKVKEVQTDTDAAWMTLDWYNQMNFCNLLGMVVKLNG